MFSGELKLLFWNLLIPAEQLTSAIAPTQMWEWHNLYVFSCWGKLYTDSQILRAHQLNTIRLVLHVGSHSSRSLTYMVLRGQAPSYLQELLVYYNPNRPLHYQKAGLLVVCTICKSRVGGRAFNRSLCCWNSSWSWYRDWLPFFF